MKDKIVNYKDAFINFIKYNRQFCSYVILSLVCTTLIRMYTLGNIFDLQPLCIDLAFILIIGAFGFLHKPQKQFKYFLIWLLIYTAMGIINSIYFTFYNSFASISLLTTLGQVGEVSEAVFDNIYLSQFIYLIFPITFFIIHRSLTNRDYFNFVAKFEKSRDLLKKILIVGVVVLGLCALTLSGTAFGRLAKQWNREYIVSKFGMIVYQGNDLVNTLKPTIISWFGYDVAVKNFTDYYNENTNKVSNNEYTNIFEGKSVIFVHMESMATFLVDLEINNQIIAPNLNKLSKEGMYFTNFYPQIGVGTSSDTEFTINTSLLPVTNGTAFVSYYDRMYATLPKLLKEKGYYTFSMHANKSSMWNRYKMHPALGYMDFYSKTSFEIDEEIGLGLSDKSFFRQAIPIIEEIESNNQKYMGTMITLTNHTPFDNNELFTQLGLTYETAVFNEETHSNEIITYDYLLGTKLGDYLTSAHYADEALGEFLDTINESEYFNNTIFVFYGDHDPRLSAKEYRNYLNFDETTGEIYDAESENYINYDYYDNELNRNTPLIIWSKNTKLAAEVNYYMGSIDILPTIGNMLGIYNKYSLGKDIFEVKNDNIVSFPNGNFLTNKVFYNNSKEEYKAISLDETLSEEYIQRCKEYADKLIELSNGIIIHDLIKNDIIEELTK